MLSRADEKSQRQKSLIENGDNSRDDRMLRHSQQMHYTQHIYFTVNRTFIVQVGSPAVYYFH